MQVTEFYRHCVGSGNTFIQFPGMPSQMRVPITSAEGLVSGIDEYPRDRRRKERYTHARVQSMLLGQLSLLNFCLGLLSATKRSSGRRGSSSRKAVEEARAFLKESARDSRSRSARRASSTPRKSPKANPKKNPQNPKIEDSLLDVMRAARLGKEYKHLIRRGRNLEHVARIKPGQRERDVDVEFTDVDRARAQAMVQARNKILKKQARLEREKAERRKAMLEKKQKLQEEKQMQQHEQKRKEEEKRKRVRKEAKALKQRRQVDQEKENSRREEKLRQNEVEEKARARSEEYRKKMTHVMAEVAREKQASLEGLSGISKGSLGHRMDIFKQRLANTSDSYSAYLNGAKPEKKNALSRFPTGWDPTGGSKKAPNKKVVERLRKHAAI